VSPREVQWLRFAALCLLLLLGGYGLSLRALQNAWLDAAGEIVSAHQAGHSVLQFPLRSSADLIGNRVLQAQASRFEADGLHLQLAPGAANVPLGLDGACLDSTLFPILQLDYQSDQPLRLALVQSPQAGGEQRLAELDLAAGSHQLRQDLRALEWRAADRPAALGDAAGRICEFRLVPVAAEATELLLADVRFAAVDPKLLRLANLQRQVSLLGRTPAQLQVEREALRRHADLIVWPEPILPGTVGATPLGLALALVTLALLLHRRQPPFATILAVAAPVLLLADNLLPGRWPLWSVLTVLLSLSCLVLVGWNGRQTGAREATNDGPPRSTGWHEALLATGLILLLAAATGALFGPPRWTWPAADDVLRYLLWAGVQQWLLHRVLAPQLNRGTDLLARLPAASAFALLHLPNFELMILCFLGALWWIDHYQRHRAWLPLILVHALLGLTLPELLPPDWLHSAEVGFRYFGPN
jgi:hypothetical protein